MHLQDAIGIFLHVSSTKWNAGLLGICALWIRDILKVESGKLAHLLLHGHHVLCDWLHLEALFIASLCWLLAGQFSIFLCNFSEALTLTQGANLCFTLLWFLSSSFSLFLCLSLSVLLLPLQFLFSVYSGSFGHLFRAAHQDSDGSVHTHSNELTEHTRLIERIKLNLPCVNTPWNTCQVRRNILICAFIVRFISSWCFIIANFSDTVHTVLCLDVL